jgi:general secretion pathway protein G
MPIRLKDTVTTGRGFSLFDLVVSISLISVLIGVFAQRFLYLQEFAEKTAMEMTVMNMRTGLRYKLAELMVTGQSAHVADLLEENPIRWLDVPPENYAGEFVDPSKAEIKAGSWYYDQGRRLLVFRLNLHAHFKNDEPLPELRFKVSGVGAEKKHARSPAREAPLMTGLGLVAVKPVAWFEE